MDYSLLIAVEVRKSKALMTLNNSVMSPLGNKSINLRTISQSSRMATLCLDRRASEIGLNSGQESELDISSSPFLQNYDLTNSVLESACGKYIYHISIIDYLQEYTLSKKSEHLIKSVFVKFKQTKLGLNSSDISATNPTAYKQRFLKFIKKKVF